MKKDKEDRFIPCGDSMERMQEILEDDLKNVSGGNAVDLPNIVFNGWTICPACGNQSYSVSPGAFGKRFCTSCDYREE